MSVLESVDVVLRESYPRTRAGIRPMAPEDRPFVTSGWSTSMRGSRDLAMIPMWGYAEIMRPIVEGCLDHPSVATLVAEGGNGVLLGFAAVDATPYSRRGAGTKPGATPEFAGYVFYVYVASPFRRWGVASDLLAAAGIDLTRPFGYAVRTRSSFEARAQAPLAEFEPYRARFLTTENP